MWPSGSALRAFELSSSAVTGRATHSIDGGAVGLPEDIYRRLRTDLGVRTVAPVVESFVAPVRTPERTLRLLGIDPFAESSFRDYLTPDRNSDFGPDQIPDITRCPLCWLSIPPGSSVSKGASTFQIEVSGALYSLQLIGFLESPDEITQQVLGDFIVTDLSTAQEALGLPGRLSRIDLQIADEIDRESNTVGDSRNLAR